MSFTFVLSTLALLLFAASFVLLLPRIWQRREQTETNIDWLRLRQAELPADAVALREEAALRLMEEGELDAAVVLADRPRYTWAGQLIGIGLMVAGVWWLYQQLGGWEDVQIAGELASLEEATPEDVLVLIDRIELRAQQRQANADYALLLAEYHLTGDNPARAVPYFQRLNCSAIGFHEGYCPGYPASHGCLRVPRGKASELWETTKVGDRVVIVP